MVGRCRQKVAPLGGIDACIVQRPGSGTGLPQPRQRYLPQRPRRRSPGGRNKPVHIRTPGRERRQRRLPSQQLQSADRHAWVRRPATPPPVPTSGRLDRPPKATRPSERAASTPVHSAPRTTLVPRATTPPPRPPAPAPHPPSPSRGVSTATASIAAAVVAAINSARAQQGLPALTVSADLQASAHAHDLAMATANQLSHQLPGEPDIGARETNAGVTWTAAGENIGWTTDMTQAGALSIEASMVGERPPNDGHRRNILSSTFTVIGVDIYLDPAHGRLWLTEDFARLA